MSLLDALKDVLPAILHKRYELRPLSPSQAREAIVEPANIENASFSSPRFEYTEGALSAIIRALSPPTSPPTSPPAPKGGVATSGVSTPPSEAKGDGATPPLGAGGLGIEAFQLQIVCEYIENLVKNGQVPDINGNGLPDITDAQLPEMKSLYRNYYHRKLAELDARDRAVAQSVLEDGLLAEDSATGEGRRTSVDSLTLINQFKNNGLTMLLLEKLEKTYLIRREVNTVGGFSFEISHDTLVEPIQEAKKERQAIEEAARLKREQIEKEKQLAEAKRQAAKERKSKMIAYFLAIAAVLSLGISYFQTLKALEANRNVVYMLMREADKSILSLNYDEALDRCEIAWDLGVAQDSTQKRLLEIAYFYTETDTLEAAMKILNFLKINALLNRTALLSAIEKNAPPQYFNFLRERYYPKMIDVEGGQFTMGSNEYNDDEKPPHKIRLSSFRMAESETTAWQYFLFQKATKYREPEIPTWQWKGDNPIVNVSWDDAMAYSTWLSERQCIKVTLPTEAEWEFAARGGVKSKGYTYSGSNDINEVAWYNSNSKSQTHSVKQLKVNELGLSDLSGNVWEWCRDNYSTTFYAECAKKGIVLNPFVEDAKADFRVLRDGSWGSYSEHIRTYIRNWNFSDFRYNYVGFRIVARYD